MYEMLVKCVFTFNFNFKILMVYPIEGRSTKLAYDVTIFHDVIRCELISEDVNDDVPFHFYVEKSNRAKQGDPSLLRRNLHYQIIV